MRRVALRGGITDFPAWGSASCAVSDDPLLRRPRSYALEKVCVYAILRTPGAEASERVRGASEVCIAAFQNEIDVLRGSGAAVKRDRVAADDDCLNRVALELLQQLSEVEG